jgi:tetratricopeptide (TPR) repeat protein
MDALLSALDNNPRTRLRARAFQVGGALVVCSSLLAMRQIDRRHDLVCKGSESRLVNVWDDEKKLGIHRAFVQTRRPYAEGAWSSVEHRFDTFKRDWVAMRTDACEATRVRGEQSEHLLDLRMQCLDQRLFEARALSDLYAKADGSVVEKAAESAQGLSGLASCANTQELLALVAPPRDISTRAKVVELEQELAQVKALRDTGQYPIALELAGKARAAAKQLAYRPLEAEASFYLGALKYDEGKPKEAEPLLFDSFAEAESSRHDKQAAQAAVFLSYVVGVQESRAQEGGHWVALGRAAVERLGGDAELKASLLNAEGLLYEINGRYDEAERSLEQAVSTRERVLGPGPDLVRSLNNLGMVYGDTYQYEKRFACYRRAVGIAEQALGPEHPLVAVGLTNLANVAIQQGGYDEAMRDLGRAIAIDERTRPNHPDFADALFNLGEVEAAREHYEQAMAAYRRAIALDEKALGPDHPDLASWLPVVADTLRERQRYDEALEMLHRAERILRQDAADPTAVATSLVGIGRVQLDRGRPAAALAPLEEALRLRTANRTAPTDLADSAFRLAEALWASGRDRSRARLLATEAQEHYSHVSATQRALNEVNTWLASHRETL